MAEKEITERESRRNLTLSTLEKTLIQNTLGANLASDFAQYGQIGKDAAKGAFNNEEIRKAKEEQYQELSKKYEALGVVGVPTYPSNADFSYNVIEGLEHVMEQSYLEDLTEGVKKIVSEEKLPEKLKELIYNFPEKLKGYVHAELIQKAMNPETGKLDLSKLEKDEVSAMASYDLIRETYRRSVTMNLVNSNYLGDLDSQAEKIVYAYNPKKEDKE